MPLGLYLHYPFCTNQCSQCNCHCVPYDPQYEERFYKALGIEIEHAAKSLAGLNYELDTIYVSGGTPSVTNLDLFANWLEQVRRLFHVTARVEFSFEMSPESVMSENLQRLAQLGMNRPVFGTRSFDAGSLKLLGYRHGLQDAHRAIYLANALGFTNYSADLMFGLPGQTGKMLSSDLDQLVDLEPPHVSFYQLKVGHGNIGKLKLPDDDLAYAMYKAGHEHLTEAEYIRYEVCSYTKPGHECRHKLALWQAEDYVGLGPSAHTFVNGRFFANKCDVSQYIETLLKGERPPADRELEREQLATDTVVLGLRMVRGVNRVQFVERFGCSLEDHIRPDQYQTLIRSGHIIDDNDTLRLSDVGFLLSDEIIKRLVK